MSNQNKYLNLVLSHSDQDDEIEIGSEKKNKNKNKAEVEEDDEGIQSTSKKSTSTIIDLTLDSPPISTNKRTQSNPSTSTSHHLDQNRFHHVKKLKQTTLSNYQSKTPEPDHPTKPSSSSSSAPSLDLDEELACPICCELFVSPVNFACGHSFCGSCAHDWLQKESVCPSCRQESTSPPARMYILESIIQKYFDHQLSMLRSEGKDSEALAMELEREEKLTQWTNRRALLDSAARLKPNHQTPLGLQPAAGLFVQHDDFPVHRGLNLPGIEGFELHHPAPPAQLPGARHQYLGYHLGYHDHPGNSLHGPARHRRNTPQPGPASNSRATPNPRVASNPRAGPSNPRSVARTWLH